MKSIPRCKVGIAVADNFDIELHDEYTLVKDVPIGIGFHWEGKMDMLIPGEISILPRSDGKKQLVAEMDVETYLEGVISSEMSPEAPEEFLRTHAIISRSWVMRKIIGLQQDDSFLQLHGDDFDISWEESSSHEGFHVCGDDHCQRYQGHGCVNDRVRKAVRDTAGIVLFAPEEDEIADARYSKCCGGITELFSNTWAPRQMSYSQFIPDPYCNPNYLDKELYEKLLTTVWKDFDLAHTRNDYFLWHSEIPLEEIRQRLLARYHKDVGQIFNLTPMSSGPSGRIIALRIDGSEGCFAVGKELAIRRLLADDCLLSSNFSLVEISEKWIRIVGHGWGHGVGLCQIGAASMALSGANFREILHFYYPNTVLYTDYGGYDPDNA